MRPIGGLYVVPAGEGLRIQNVATSDSTIISDVVPRVDYFGEISTSRLPSFASDWCVTFELLPLEEGAYLVGLTGASCVDRFWIGQSLHFITTKQE